ncbi:MAG TPA: ABC transporter substrate-binding protein, partial [Chloroflexota bacterium]|nr:ABC transporter substrate-binding protein [Chloroflexota bacterium]
HPVGTGPFVLQSWQKATDTVVLARNPYYFRTGKPYVDQVVVSYNMPSSLIALKIEKGELDGYGSDSEVAGTDVKQARSDPRYMHYLVPAPLTWVFWLDIDVRIAPMTNLMLRQAVAMAIDRQRLVQLQGGQATPAYQLYVALDPQHDPSLDQHPAYPFDPRKAAALVKASGYHGQPIVILYFTPGGDVRGPEVIQQDLQQIGLTVSLRAVPNISAQSVMSSTQGHNLQTGSWSIDFPDAYDLYSGQFACSDNTATGTSGAHYCDPTADNLVAKAQSLSFGAARTALLREAQLRLLRSAAYVPLYYFKSIDMVSPRVGGFYYEPIYGWVLEDYWVSS